MSSREWEKDYLSIKILKQSQGKIKARSTRSGQSQENVKARSSKQDKGKVRARTKKGQVKVKASSK